MRNFEEIVYNFIMNQGIEIEYDIFSYGFSVLKSYLIFILLIIPISIMCNTLLETIAFVIVFTSLRQYLGGLHFDSSLVCMIVSLLVATVIPLLAISINDIKFIIRMIGMLFTYISVNFIGIIDHKNKILNDREKSIFKNRANIILLFYSIIIFFLYEYISLTIVNTVFLTILIMNFNLIIPYLAKTFMRK